MRIRVSVALGLTFFLALPGLLLAQAAPATAKPAAISVTIVYHENNSGMFDIRDETGASLGEPADGDELKVGWTVVTGKGDLAELKLTHTATIIKVSGNTNFRLESLRTDQGGQDVFSLAIGKVRTVAGKASTKDLYQIKTQSAVCGVRGSDIVVETPDGIAAKESTLEGTGWIQNAGGQVLDIAQGFDVDTAADTFQPVKIPDDVFKGLQDDMKFTRLDPAETQAVAKAYQASLQQPAPAEKPAEQRSGSSGNGQLDGALSALRDILGFEIGSINVSGPNGETLTYAQAVFEPTFTLGKLKMALYLPIIYQGDMFNSSDYYRPSGNNEWSFGGDQHGTRDQVADATRDVLLKIKYIEYGKQRDPFFIKVGNLDDITLGHGLIMQNFANDADFPAVRHVGLNLGVDAGGGGFEFMANDLAPDLFNGTFYPPDIMGLRMYMRILGRAALGISGVVDLNPGRDLPVYGPDLAGNMVFISPGVDLDIPMVETDSLGLIFFTDGSVLMPYLRTVPTFLPGLKPGLQTAAFYDGSAKMPVKNWGTATGIFGNLVTPDFTYKLEYELYTGTFIPQLYNAAYERNRPAYVYSTLLYLSNGAATLNTYYMGIYGEVGFKIASIVTVKAGYFWPWDYDATDHSVSYNSLHDHFLLDVTIGKIVPFVPISAGFSYERQGFVYTLQHDGASGALFDARTVVTAHIAYTVSPIMDVTLLYTVVASRDANGNIVYEDQSSLLPKTNASVSVQTQIHL